MPREAEVIGGLEIRRKLEKLGSKTLVAKVTRSAIGKAGTAVKKKAKTYAPVESGLLRESIHSMTKTKNGIIFGIVGPRRGLKRSVFRTLPNGEVKEEMADPVRYAHLVELGTSHSAPKPFLRPAFDNTPIENIITTKLWDNYTKEVDKMKGATE